MRSGAPERVENLPLREEIVAIVHEIIQNHRYVLLENLLQIAKKETGAERIAVENVINHLIRDKVIVPGSRLVKQLLLQNDTRKKIYGVIKQFPGVNINSIKKTLNLGSNAVMWHLGVLLKFGCIQEIAYKTNSIFTLPKVSLQKTILCIFLRKKLIRMILSTIEGGPMSLAELEKNLGENKSTILYNLVNVEESNIIIKENIHGIESVYKLNDEIKDLYHSLKGTFKESI